MATAAQILANRLNSQKSTGPRSDEGKAASSMNALKHGARAHSLLIPGEDPAEFDALASAYRAQYNPVGPEEELLLDTIVRADWTQRRMARLEAQLFLVLVDDSDAPESALGAAFHRDAAGANSLQKIFRRQEAANRQWYRARKELAALQNARLTREFHQERQAKFAASRPSAPIPPTPRQTPAAPPPPPPAMRQVPVPLLPASLLADL